MTRSKKLKLNMISSLFYQIVCIVCGIILPRCVILSYGSTVNGLVSSITYFLGIISLAECGVGAVVQSSLYDPLAHNDRKGVSMIVVSSNRFFKNISLILLLYTIVLMIALPLQTIDSFDYIYTVVLILVISISLFAQYYIGMTYKLLLNADQLGFIQYTISAISMLLNTFISVILMNYGATIHLVKLISSLIFIIQPITIAFIANKKYELDYEILIDEEPIKQKWNGMAQHIATVVLGATDTVVLTLFSSLENVSIYSIYFLIVNGIKQVLFSLTNGIQALLGNMLAKKETETLNTTFDIIEWITHNLVTLFFSLTALLIIPFITIYTKDITDANYILPVFAILIVLSQATYCLRLPYNIMILAAGHFKQTQNSAIIEVIINISFSIILVFNYGLIGVAIGTILAMTYRTIYFVLYLKQNILYRKIKHFIKNIIVDLFEIGVLLLFIRIFPQLFLMNEINYYSWIVLAIKEFVLCIIIIIPINFIFNKEKFKLILKYIKNRRS